jgi:hypothetical protein
MVHCRIALGCDGRQFPEAGNSLTNLAQDHERPVPEDCPMRGFRAVLKSVSTTWAAADHSKMWRALGVTATVLATTMVVALASFVAVALSLS